jgi:uncharacterized protein
LASPTPIQQRDRTVIVDVLRGFALFGVLLGNFSSMLTNNVPHQIIETHATAFDSFLSRAHDIFIENKFMTIFSILFGYGFGVIMQRLENKNINATPFFLRRMFWLFVLGCMNLALWSGDILHIYAMAGVCLLLFRRRSNRFVLLSSAFFLLILPVIIRLYRHYFLRFPVSEEAIVNEYYQAYKFGTLKNVVRVNYQTYPSEWIFTWIEWRDLSETLGRFLLGYYILRKQFLVKLNENISFIRKIRSWTLPFTILYIALIVLQDKSLITAPSFVLYPFLKTGVLFMAVFYMTSLVQLYYNRKLQKLMQLFRNLGCMTLTNYLTETIIYVVVFYHLGFGLLGDFSFGIIWLSSVVVYILQGLFSKWWLSKYYYGPVEWIWRQLTYRQRFELKKQL